MAAAGGHLWHHRDRVNRPRQSPAVPSLPIPAAGTTPTGSGSLAMTRDDRRALPFVSVVVPVYNDRRRIGACLAALLDQAYPRNCYEVIVVDNGSIDGTREVVAAQPVTLLVETRVRGSYAARNRALREARGEVIAFTDADCVPTRQWIAAGVHALEAQAADLAGGAVRLVASPRPSGAEIYDSITNMRQERTIRERQVAKTASLFVRARLFETLGPFTDSLPSGGDVDWTGRATRRGYRLIFVQEAEVIHPTRRLLALLGKQFRVGRGQYGLRREDVSAQTVAARGPGRTRLALGAEIRRAWPRSLHELRREMEVSGVPVTPYRLARVWAAGSLCRLFTVLGTLTQALRSGGQ
jgi:glycosyltransferase AglE